jgi:hypothetical protein
MTKFVYRRLSDEDKEELLALATLLRIEKSEESAHLYTSRAS